MNYLNQLALGSALAMAGAAQAMIVDRFDTPLGGATLSIVNPPGPLTVSYGPTTYGSIRGTRSLTYTITALGPTVDAVKIGVGGSGLVETADNNGVPSLVLNYTGRTADLMGNNTLTLFGFDTNAKFEQVQATFFDGAAGVSSSGWVTVAGNHTGDLVLTLTGTANLADIEHINVQFQGDAGADFTLRSIIAIPEPSTYGGLTALGLLGTVIWRRLRA